MTVPNGLSLAPTAVPQSATTTLDAIPGGQSKTATWVLRGDKEGSYDLAASYAGTLEPFGDTVTVYAVTEQPLHVWGGSALQLTVDADDTAREHYPYHVTVGLSLGPCSPPRIGSSLVVDHQPPNLLLVAVDETERVVGYTAAHPEDGELFLLVVDPDDAGRGIGRTLLSAAHDTLPAAGCTEAFKQL